MDLATWNEQIAPRLVLDDETGCHRWTGTHQSAGYGRVTLNGEPYSVHRLAHELFVGPIPEGMDLDHLCRVRDCARPDHLEPVTRSENIRRGAGAGGVLAPPYVMPETCRAGHALVGDNLGPPGTDGSHWRCRTCDREDARRRYDTHR